MELMDIRKWQITTGVVGFLALVFLGAGIFYFDQAQKAISLIDNKNSQISQLSGNLAETALKKEEAEKQLAQKEKDLAKIEKDLAAKTKELKDSQAQIENQQAQLSQNAAELEKLRGRPPLFSFQNKSSTLTDIEAKKAAVKDVVTKAYDVIAETYSQPYLLNSVTIAFVDQFSNPKASGEILISNSNTGINLEIHLKDFDANSFNDVNTIIHEIVHSFHGLAAMNNVAFEEGETIAATDAVMAKMVGSGSLSNFDRSYVTISENQYQKYNNSIDIPASRDSFYDSKDVAIYYQMTGYAWKQLYNADPNFFKKFNEAYYNEIKQGKEASKDLVLAVLKNVAPNADLTQKAFLP